jgi:hypothetical protein
MPRSLSYWGLTRPHRQRYCSERPPVRHERPPGRTRRSASSRTSATGSWLVHDVAWSPDGAKLASIRSAMSSTFAGWSGDCTGTGACTVRMAGPRDVAATFNTVPPPPRPARRRHRERRDFATRRFRARFLRDRVVEKRRRRERRPPERDVAPGLHRHAHLCGSRSRLHRSCIQAHLGRGLDNTATLKVAPASAPPPSGGGPSAPHALTPPAITGAAVVGHVLHATAPRWSAKPTTVAYRRQICSTKGCSAISRATAASLRVIRATSADACEWW